MTISTDGQRALWLPYFRIVAAPLPTNRDRDCGRCPREASPRLLEEPKLRSSPPNASAHARPLIVSVAAVTCSALLDGASRFEFDGI